jgi:hypothetical protein
VLELILKFLFKRFFNFSRCLLSIYMHIIIKDVFIF